jgi:hypothetical protein
MARRIDDDEALAAALVAAQFAFWAPGQARARRELAEELIETTERLGAGRLRVDAHMFMAIICLELCDLEAADASIARHAELAANLQQPELMLLTTSFRAMRALQAGEWDRAEEALQEIAAAGPRSTALDMRQNQGVYKMALSSERDSLGDHHDEFASLFRETSMAGWRAVLSWSLAQAGDDEAARRELAELRPDNFAAFRRDSNFVPSMAAAAHAVAELGDAELAGEMEPLLRPYAEFWVLFGAALTLGPVAYYVGLLNLIQDNLDAAVADFELALERCELMRARPYEAHTLFGLSEALRRRENADDLERAGELRERAVALANELEMTRLLRAARPG